MQGYCVYDCHNIEESLSNSGKLGLWFMMNLFENISEICYDNSIGNHDSSQHLEAPREFLKRGRTRVVGLVSEAGEGGGFLTSPTNTE